MPRVTAEIEVQRPPAEVFEAVADPATRRRLLPDNFRDFRVTSESSTGPGARSSFTIVTPEGAHQTEIEVSDWNPPHALTEVALGPDGYTIEWHFDEIDAGTHVWVTQEYAVTGSVLHRLVDRWFARRALHQSLLVELMRLKQHLEG